MCQASSVYDGEDEDNWCSSQIPLLDSRDGVNVGGSDACCEIQKYGHMDFYLDVGNVRIFG